jgi:hypothetical protein
MCDCATEHGRCDVCGKNENLTRTYFHYPIKCECHSPNHFELRHHGKDCTPKEPIYTKVEFKTEDLKNPVSIAMPILIDELKKDKSPGSYYYAWQSNIACAIMDTMPDVDNIHELANIAAKRFLDILAR